MQQRHDGRGDVRGQASGKPAHEGAAHRTRGAAQQVLDLAQEHPRIGPRRQLQPEALAALVGAFQQAADVAVIGRRNAPDAVICGIQVERPGAQHFHQAVRIGLTDRHAAGHEHDRCGQTDERNHALRDVVLDQQKAAAGDGHRQGIHQAVVEDAHPADEAVRHGVVVGGEHRCIDATRPGVVDRMAVDRGRQRQGPAQPEEGADGHQGVGHVHPRDADAGEQGGGEHEAGDDGQDVERADDGAHEAGEGMFLGELCGVDHKHLILDDALHEDVQEHTERQQRHDRVAVEQRQERGHAAPQVFLRLRFRLAQAHHAPADRREHHKGQRQQDRQAVQHLGDAEEDRADAGEGSADHAADGHADGDQARAAIGLAGGEVVGQHDIEHAVVHLLEDRDGDEQAVEGRGEVGVRNPRHDHGQAGVGQQQRPEYDLSPPAVDHLGEDQRYRNRKQRVENVIERNRPRAGAAQEQRRGQRGPIGVRGRQKRRQHHEAHHPPGDVSGNLAVQRLQTGSPRDMPAPTLPSFRGLAEGVVKSVSYGIPRGTPPHAEGCDRDSGYPPRARATSVDAFSYK